VNQLGMLAKYWRPGSVKTRLARSIGNARASQLYRHFVVVLLRRLQAAGDRRILAYCPVERRAEFAEITPVAWELAPQSPGDLGQRICAFFAAHLKHEQDRVVLIGTDSPTLPIQIINDAFESLRTNPVVLGPTSDGGYYLVGATGRVPPIFAGIDWSSSLVWQQTLGRLHEAGSRFAELPVWYDVDDLADLRQIGDELKQLEQADPSWNGLSSEVQAALANAS
jgi:rSAM/selenodomain-associated transferase 1